ncbi:sensor histidine kinase [Bradyrhizobium sp. JYMT SZCCT0428]|uniref:sensor histidine kinase n=1 Tax=Bradyrhizobium sp. JYMT SZCCT0428 TaxID=2807673 RepID=UPI001BABEF97|nr:PAS domain-containing sensor histidine kinase [Bradyrhizobium sp. JYMT SZCCT0428]MBR1153981.1 PAS domain S-box protein [Bradyrhizobium sp. JYMT SZCCT0428]
MSERLSRMMSRPTGLQIALMLVGVAVIFAIDTFAPLDIEIAVLYAVVVIASADFLGRRGILLVCAACVLQTLLSYVIVHSEAFESGPVLRALIGLCAIGIATLAALRNRKAAESLSDQAALLDLTHDAIFVRNGNDVITYWNAGAEKLYGWPRKEALGQKSHALLKTKYLLSAGTMEQLDDSSRWQGELVHTRRDGTEVWVVSRWAMQRDERGRPFATMETNSDITEQKQAEDALRHARSQLEHVTRISTLGELTASIAHEVNQPLAAIVTNGEASLRWLLRDEPNLEEVRSAVERMIGNGRRASDVIARLRALARKSNPSHAVLTLNDIVADVIPLVEREMHNNDVALKVDLQAPAPLVLGDRVQLAQVIINLVVNAIHAMSQIEGRRRLLSITSRTSLEDSTSQMAVLEIEDTGTGIDPKVANNLFAAFYTTKADGMGMGLSISRTIVESHGGSISATSGDRWGALFKIRLPVLQQVEATAAADLLATD